MVDQFQGDPKIFITADGAEIAVENGQPIMDGGLENAVLISLFTLKGWVGNVLFRKNSEKIGGRFQAAANQSITLSALTDISNAAKDDLQWMIDEGILSTVEATTRNPQGRILETLIQLQPVGSDLETLLLQRNGENWIIQINDPAHRRI